MNIPTEVNILIPLVLITLNEGLKKYFNMPSKFAILINWFGGIGLNLALTFPFSDPQDILFKVLIGFMLGSSAGGLYDGGKAGVETARTMLKG